MAYNELVKNFNRVREYMREFYVYGFKSRDEINVKSARSYDDSRRRLESWLGDYMRFRQTPDGKNVFISIDSRKESHNPLYKAWKSKSFTDKEITLHFILFDILHDSDTAMTLAEIMESIDEYLSEFAEPLMYDESTVRKKLKEYLSLGLLVSDKKGKTIYYRRAEETEMPNPDMLDFFSEVLPCGVIGSFLLDKTEPHDNHFSFKHHYITGAMDSEVIFDIFAAIREKRSITLRMINRSKERTSESQVVPLKIMISAQNGRHYLMAYSIYFNRIESFRIDNIISVEPGEVSERFDELQKKFENMRPHVWGVSGQGRSGDRMEHVDFTVRYTDKETHIRNRLEREKRCGTVEHIDANTSRFSADVYDAWELIPWIRTFICRIVDINFSNHRIQKQFEQDMEDMYSMYGIGGDGE